MGGELRLAYARYSLKDLNPLGGRVPEVELFKESVTPRKIDPPRNRNRPDCWRGTEGRAKLADAPLVCRFVPMKQFRRIVVSRLVRLAVMRRTQEDEVLIGILSLLGPTSRASWTPCNDVRPLSEVDAAGRRKVHVQFDAATWPRTAACGSHPELLNVECFDGKSVNRLQKQGGKSRSRLLRLQAVKRLAEVISPIGDGFCADPGSS